MPEPEITIRVDDLRALFDIAVNSLDFSSGFWEQKDTEVARKFAVLLGVDPIEATPQNSRRFYPHEFHPMKALDVCSHCSRPAAEHQWPEEKPDA